MLLNLTYFSSEPINNQIVNQILLRIVEEDKLPGDELDSIGKLSRQHHIGKTSVKKAFEKLELLGVIQSSENEKYIINDISTKELKKMIDRNYYSVQKISEYDIFSAELDAAKQIQNKLLPQNLPNDEKIGVSAYSTISDEVGGDFYDFFEIDKNKYGIIIGDASGKGLPAAMLISQIQAIIKSDLSLKRSIEQTIYLINSYLSTYSASKHFATLFYGVLDMSVGELNYINAGHNYPIILNEQIDIIRLKTSGPALGLMINANYKQRMVKTNSSDLIFLFTDGLTERMNSMNIQFGEEKVIEILQDQLENNTQEIVNEINKEVSHYLNNHFEIGDTTFMAVRIKKIRKVA